MASNGRARKLALLGASTFAAFAALAILSAYYSNESAYTPTKLPSSHPNSSINGELGRKPSPAYGIVQSINGTAAKDEAPGSIGSISNPFVTLFEYRYDLASNDVFPNHVVKDEIISLQNETGYHLATLSNDILGQHIDATNVTIFVRPSKLDSDNVRLDFYLYAEKAKLSTENGGHGIMDRTYDGLELKSIYGIYNKSTDRIVVHVPYAAAFSLLRH